MGKPDHTQEKRSGNPKEVAQVTSISYQSFDQDEHHGVAPIEHLSEEISRLAISPELIDVKVHETSADQEKANAELRRRQEEWMKKVKHVQSKPKEEQ